MKSATKSIALLAVLLIGLVSFAQAASAVAPVAPVAFGDAVADAQSLASQHSDSKVLKISGSSMHPFFGEGAVIVVKPISESKLRAGMVVVYKNRFGETVAHRLVSQQNTGWTAKGYNNSEIDSTPVNSSNILGVVYATFHSNGNSASNVSLDVALAAPAR